MGLFSKQLSLHWKGKNVRLVQERLSKLGYSIKKSEIEQMEFGETTHRAVIKFQMTAGLPSHGIVDPGTLLLMNKTLTQKIGSKWRVDTPYFQVDHIQHLQALPYPLRLNMKKNSVSTLQQLLAYLQFDIDIKEAEQQVYGKTTLEAVKAFQGLHDLPVTGEVDEKTARLLNIQIAEENPDAFAVKYRVRGTVRDEAWQGMSGISVQLIKKTLRKETVLATKKTFSNGFYDIQYPSPYSGKRLKPTFQIKIVFTDKQGNVLKTEWLKRPKKRMWVNYTAGEAAYKGRSEYENLTKVLHTYLEDLKLVDIEESEKHQDISYLSSQSGLPEEEIMRMVFSHRLQKQTGVSAEVFYAFLRQNMPPGLPGHLLESTEQWNWISRLEEHTLRGLLEMEQELQESTLNNALQRNLIPKAFAQDLSKIIKQFGNLRGKFALEKPDLPGQVSLKSLLDITGLDEAKYEDFTAIYTSMETDKDRLWKKVSEIADDITMKDLQLTLDIGHITKNHIPTVKLLKSEVKSAKQLAAFDHREWVEWINANIIDKGEHLPENIDGDTVEEKTEIYATILKQRTEYMFPSDALIARVAQGNSKLSRAKEIQRFLYDQPDFDLKQTHVDRYIKESKVQIHSKAVEEMKVIQRISKLASDADSGNTLLEQNIHSSAQIYFQGKQRFTTRMEEASVNRVDAQKIYDRAAQQYAQLLSRISQFRGEFQQLTPSVIQSMDISEDTKQEYEGMANLDMLFGSMDYCDCDHCRSVYSPSAYFVDLLRFLQEKDALPAHTSAKDILFARRQDLGEIELSCTNTNTSVPYIDLVNEVLEESVASDSSYSRQTTGTVEDRLANPEYILESAYDELKQQAYPWSLPFDLRLQEVRTYLNHLGVKRHEIIQAFSPTLSYPETINQLEWALEYLNISHAHWELMTERVSREPWQYWGFQEETVTIYDPGNPASKLQGKWTELLSRADVFLQQSRLDVDQLMDLFDAKFVNPRYSTGGSVFSLQTSEEHNLSTCSLEHLYIHINGDAGQNQEDLLKLLFRRIHQFVRLADALGWSFRELDKAISVFQASLPWDLTFLTKLAQIQLLMNEHGVSFMSVMSWWSNLDTEGGSQSQYDRLFLNETVVKPHDSIFELNEERNELKYIQGEDLRKYIRDYADVVTAGLQISSSDLFLLMEELNIADDLTLDHLSQLYRHVSLAKCLHLSVSDYVQMIHLVGQDPFQANVPSSVLEFIEDVKKMNSFEFTPAEIQYILGRQKIGTDLEPSEKTIILLLLDIREKLVQIEKEFNIQELADSTEEKVSEWLTLLPKEAAMIEQFMAVISNKRTFSSNLTTLPDQLELEQISSTRGLVFYDTEWQQLRFDGVMSDDQRNDLLQQSNDPAYELAIHQLYDQPREFLIRHMRAYEDTTIGVELLALPAEVKIPKKLQHKVYYDAVTNQLHCSGKLTVHERDVLMGLSNNASYAASVQALYEKEQSAQSAENIFLTAEEGHELLEIPELEGRYTYVLQRLSPYLKKNKSEKMVIQKMSQSLGLEPVMMEELLTVCLNSPVDSGPRRSIEDFLVTEITELHPDQTWTAETLPGPFETYILLHKVSLVLRKLNVQVHQLPWFFQGEANVLNLNRLSNNTESLKSWYAMMDMMNVLNQGKNGEAVVSYMLTQSFTSKQDWMEKMCLWNEWPQSDLIFLFGKPDQSEDRGYLQMNLSEQATLNFIKQLHVGFALLEKIGVSAERCVQWIRLDVKREHAHSAIQAVKSKFESEQWLKVAEPLRNDLREQQRTALVDYLLANPLTDEQERPKWVNENGMYAYFLLDVEMSACQLTSRMKQAISSVQLFVQRCMMNLESQVATREEDGWDQWEWMKNYRIWEANRKVFLYPENLLQPELRTDKTIFYEELENELQQREMTSDHAEKAFLHYLEKLDETARLDVCGIFHEVDEGTDIMHIIARTKTSPVKYFYRQYIDHSHWSSWEHVDLDIQGEHVIPVVYQRKLYLFWPIFQEMVDERHTQPPAKASDKPQRAPQPKKYLEIQLAWSVRQSGKWSSENVSKRKLIHPWQRPYFSYHFKPRHIRGDLWFYVYISTSREFNEEKFYLPEEDQWSRVTEMPFDESARPWHSSILVFNGDVIDIKLKNLRDSYQMVRNGYGEEGRKTKRMYEFEEAPRLILPPGMHFHNMKLVNNTDDLNANRLNVTAEHKSRLDSGHVLKSANHPFSLVISHQDAQFNSRSRPFFYQDDQRSFFIKPTKQYKAGNYFAEDVSFDTFNAAFRIQYTFYPFYHPFTTLFIEQLKRYGLKGLFRRELQAKPEQLQSSDSFDFNREYKPVLPAKAHETAAHEVVDFSYGGAYAPYNWELFFHAPFMIASHLNQNQKFKEAMDWLHFIFDPTNATEEPTPQRFWKTNVFYEQNKKEMKDQRIQRVLQLVNQGDQETMDQVTVWRKHPFQPHMIAQMRPIAYQKAVVMKYIDNLLDWGDMLFRRDTIESINEASLLYILAAEILGERPQRMPGVKKAETMTYNELEHHLDTFGNAVYEVENTLPAVYDTAQVDTHTEPLPRIEMFYFCIPHNQELMEYWNRVEDRLFKIRHCMNIEGTVRQLPLFEPPIDPALLVKAAGKGVDLNRVMNDLHAPLPNYRFTFVIQKAQQFAQEVKALGSLLLGALEKRDAEQLSALRASHERKLKQAMKDMKDLRMKEAEEAVKGLEKSKEMAQQRKHYYENLDYMNHWEITALSLSGASTLMDTAIAAGYTLAGGLKLIPNFIIGASGFGGSPHATAETPDVAGAAENAVKTLSALSNSLHKMSTLASTMGSYERRQEEWDQQKAQAEMEISRIEHDIEAANLRVAISEQEWQTHQMQMEQSESVEEFLLSKYTNQELYEWMIQQISSIYFQSYQLAFEMAKQAESCYRYELGMPDSSFIQFGYWDSLKKGLLAGDKLAHDLNRLEAAYMDDHRRELELTKHISLAQIAPLSLISLKETGSCMVELPEWLLDMDYPGHYMRRIKSVQLSIPCVSGPYTSINCTLTLIKSSTRVNGSVTNGYKREGMEDDRFVDHFGATQSIATSHGQSDSGMFELSFRDDRYLPFEGAGMMSTWRIDLPKENNHIDFSTISDVVLHTQYTAKDGGSALQQKVQFELDERISKQGVQLFNLSHQFPDAWYRFLHPDQEHGDQILTVKWEEKHFPFFVRHKNLKLKKMDFIIQGSKGDTYELVIQTPEASEETLVLIEDSMYGEAHHGEKQYETGTQPDAKGVWTFKLKRNEDQDYHSLPPDLLDHFFMVIQYETN